MLKINLQNILKNNLQNIIFIKYDMILYLTIFLKKKNN